MKNYFRLILVAMVVLLVQFNAFGQEITPDPRIQAQIERITSIENLEDLFNEIPKLKGMEENLEHLIQQLIYFDLNAEGTEKGMRTVTIFWKILNIDETTWRLPSASAQSFINAVLPYLGTKNADLKRLLYDEWLPMIDSLRGHDEIDYSHYESFIESRKKNPPLPLIQYMYEKSPGEALLVLTRIYVENPKAREPIIQAQQAVSADIKNRGYDVDRSRAVSVLEEFSRDRRWWVRLYVAEIMNSRHQPEAYYKNDAPEVFKRLQRDRSSVVRSVFKRPQK